MNKKISLLPARHQLLNWKNSIKRLSVPSSLAIGLAVAGMSMPSAQAANTTDLFTATGSGASWSTATNWSNGLPTSTSDVLFAGTDSASSTITATAFQIGSFNATRAEAVTNGTSTTTASTLTLGGGSATTDQVPGSNPADLIFVNAVSTLNGGTTGALNLVLGQSGQFDAVGTTLGIGTAGTASTLSLGTGTGAAAFTLTLTGELAAPNNGGITINSVVSGTGSIIKTGNNQAALGGANTFTGTVTIEQGNLNPSNATALGASTNTSAIALGDATSVTNNLSPFLLISGATNIARAITVGANNGATTGFYAIGSGNGSSQATYSGAITLNQNLFVTNAGANFNLTGTVTSGGGAQTLIINDTGAQTDSAIISNGAGTLSLTKVGAGTATLSNAQTYTGATTVNQGTLAVSGSLASASLTVGGGTFSYTAASGGTQAFTGGTTINTGGSVINANAGDTLNLGAITRSGNGTVNFSTTGTKTTTSTGANGILGPYAFTGATTTLSYVTGGTINAYAAGTTTTDATGVTDTTGTVNYNVPAGGQVPAGSSANTLRYTGAAGTVTGPVTLNGLMNAGTGALTVAGNVSAGSTNELVVLSNGQNVTLSGITADNGANPVAVTFGGTGGLFTLTNNNTYTGGTTVNTGTLALPAGSTGGAGIVVGALTVNNGATVNLTGNNALGFTAGQSVTTVNVNLGGTISNTFAGSPSTSNQGFLTSFNLTGGTVSSVGGSFNFNVGATTAPTITSNASTFLSTFSAPIVIRNTGTLTFNVASGVIGQDPRTASDLTVSGAILADNVTTASVGGISKKGAGVLTLTAANTYNGGTSISAGTLLTSVGGTLGTGNVTVSGTGALTLDNTGTSQATVNTATLSFAGTTTITLNNTTADSLAAITDSDNSTTIAGGTYTAAQLDTAFGVTSFTGPGSLTVVPETSTWVGGLLFAGTVGYALRRRAGARLV